MALSCPQYFDPERKVIGPVNGDEDVAGHVCADKNFP